jgi:apolipoprotein N-acyltransferase
VGLALASSGLLWLCYFPVAWGWLAWVALVPLLALVRCRARPGKVYLAAWCGGVAFFGPALQWLRVADERMYFTWVALALYCALYFPLGVYLVRRLDRGTRLPLVLTVPVVWTALEFFRANFFGGFATRLLGDARHSYPGGFSWYCLGYTQHAFLPLIQIADLAGVYGVTFLVAAGNALVFEALYGRRWFRDWCTGPGTPARWGRLALLVQGLGMLVLLFATLAYGGWRLGQDMAGPGPVIALIQGNVPQQLRNLPGPSASDEEVRDAKQEMMRDYVRLSDRVARHGPDLIVWPETSYPDGWAEQSPGEPAPASRQLALDMARRWHTEVLVGVNAHVLGPPEQSYNSAVLIDRQGRQVARYDKIHRVPFGEYIPLRESLPFLNRFAPYDYEYSVRPGAEHTRFPLTSTGGGHWTFGVVICYEDTVAEMALPYAGGDGRPAADFVLNLSNDGWFDGTSEHDEHLAICRFRAVECRRSVARAVNMGISALIDGNGRVLDPLRVAGGRDEDDQPVWQVPPGPGVSRELPLSRWGEYKKTTGALLASVPLDRRASFYARWGDWLPAACWLGLLAGLAGALVGRGGVRA